MSAYLFIDVDGVLNPDTKWATRLDSTFIQRHIGQYHVWVSRYQSEWLLSLLDQGVTIVWATTWVNDEVMLATLADHLNLPSDLPRIYGIDYEDIRNCGKRAGVEKWLEENEVDPHKSPCVWVDDLLGDDDRAWAWRRSIFPVTVDDRIGLADRRIIRTIEVGLGLDVVECVG